MIVWAWDQRLGAQLFLFVFTPVSVLCSTTIDNPGAAVLAVAPGAPLDRRAISGDREWVLVMGDHPLPTDVVEQSSGDGYVLFRLPSKSADGRTVLGERTIDFTHPFRFGLVKRVSGLSVSSRSDVGRTAELRRSSCSGRCL